jgi:ARG/rhodanese/phosphatase superfamily protein
LKVSGGNYSQFDQGGFNQGGFNQGFQGGFNQGGFNQGFQGGFNQGGFNQGFQAGFNQGGFNQGFQAGFNQGFQGFNQGFQGGFQFGGQGGVWMEVGRLQNILRTKLGPEILNTESESSLQLTLEHPKVKKAIEKYTSELSKALEGQKDVIGYAFAINGQVNSIDIYGSSEVFAKLWPKLLRANALEALLEREEGKSYPAVKAEDVKAILLDTEKGEVAEKDISKRVRVLKRETEKSVLFETCDRERGAWLHRSYLTK